MEMAFASRFIPDYRVPHNYLNQKLKTEPAIPSKSLVNYETSGSAYLKSNDSLPRVSLILT
jgi:hypothetical protein